MRILAFSSFSILLIAAVGVFRARPESAVFVEFSLVALGLLHFYISVIFILDRYYERMLMIAVNRASRLEAVRLNRFKIGLTTEIEEGKNISSKNTVEEKISGYLSSAGKMVVFVYGFVFTVVLLSFAIVLVNAKVELIFSNALHWALFVFLAALGGFLIRFSFNVMKAPLSEARMRAQVANSPEILSENDIDNCVKNIAKDTKKWLDQEKTTFLNVVCILNGARRVTEELVAYLKDENVTCRVSYIKTRSTQGVTLADKIELEYGNIAKPDKDGELALIVDDLVDSGRTLEKVKSHVIDLGYEKTKTATLLNKYVNVDVADFVGFNLCLSEESMNSDGIKDYWVFGYGMDIHGFYRDLDYIGWIEIANENA